MMLERHMVIPDGMDVDHVDKDRLNDSIENLRLRDSVENQLDNLSKRQLEEAHSFFDEIIAKNKRS